MSFARATLLRPGGYAILTGESGPVFERDTFMCVHCGMPVFVVKGSKRPHLHCQRCGGWTCSNEACLRDCYPFEKQMDDLEAGKNPQQLREHGWQPVVLTPASEGRIVVP